MRFDISSSLFITCGGSLCCNWPSGCGGGSPGCGGCLESCLRSSGGGCFHNVIEVKDLIFQDEWSSCFLYIVAVVGGAETGLDGAAAIIGDVTDRTEVLRGQRVPDGAQEDPGGEALPQRGRLRGGLAPGVHQAGLATEAGLGLGRVGRVKLVTSFVRVEETPA